MAQDFGIGVFAAFVEAIILQPTLYWKNANAQGKPWTMDPRVLYRGSGASIYNECQMMGLQFGITSLISTAMGGNDSELISAVGGGSIAAVFASPVELVMIQQQNNGGSAWKNIKSLGVANSPSILFRGLEIAILRDGIYVGAMLGLTPILNRHIQEEYGQSPTASNFYASLIGGIIAAVPSHPFDMVKTCMQGDLQQKTYGNSVQALGTIWKQGGIKRLFSGGMWRTINITATVYIANEINIWAKQKLKEDKR